jgi:hypothetical protein
MEKKQNKTKNNQKSLAQAAETNPLSLVSHSVTMVGFLPIALNDVFKILQKEEKAEGSQQCAVGWCCGICGCVCLPINYYFLVN